MGKDGCTWFQWAFHDPHGITPSAPLQTSPPLQPGHLSSPKKCTLPTTCYHTQSTDISLSSPLLHHHMLSVKLSGPSRWMKPLLYAHSYNFVSLQSHKQSSSTTTLLHEHTSSSPWIWPFDFYVDKMDIGFKNIASSLTRTVLWRKCSRTTFMSSSVDRPSMITVDTR